MVAGHLRAKNGRWYAVLTYKTESGKNTEKWFSTGLKEKGNKKKAKEKLLELRREYTCKLEIFNNSNGIYFHDYILAWLEKRENEVSKTTYRGYYYNVKHGIAPYFKERNILLSELEVADINDYYQYLLNDRGVSPTTAIHHHANIYSTLKEARRNNLIPHGILDNLVRPKEKKFIPTVYSVDECNKLLRAVKGEQLEIVIILALFLGLRRSEILGLRWKAINFENNTMIINHTVTSVLENGHYTISRQDSVKRKSSFRTLPIPDRVYKYLLKEYKARYTNCTPKLEEYICMDKKGKIIQPDYVTETFVKILEKSNLRRIRFHDLRHSFANLLISSRVPLIEVQQWLGHSNIRTTADMYSHLSFETLVQNVKVIDKKLKI